MGHIASPSSDILVAIRGREAAPSICLAVQPLPLVACSVRPRLDPEAMSKAAPPLAGVDGSSGEFKRWSRPSLRLWESAGKSAQLIVLAAKVTRRPVHHIGRLTAARGARALVQVLADMHRLTAAPGFAALVRILFERQRCCRGRRLCTTSGAVGRRILVLIRALVEQNSVHIQRHEALRGGVAALPLGTLLPHRRRRCSAGSVASTRHHSTEI
mmetsp:Transcript_170120/g.545552  ORF Transcript_170120/g.545552 Transcript_170120/m.545552 type:complete len:214 (-) Transcript_170120:9-650(-)